MSNLRDRLEAKKRRRVTIPVQIDTPPDGVVQALEAAASTVRILVYSGRADDDPDLVAARDAQDRAQKALDEYCVDVEFLALPDDDMEALAATYRLEDGDLDVKAIAAPLAAACAVDEGLRDEQWWQAQIPAWSHGERVTLSSALINLNYSGSKAKAPKG